MQCPACSNALPFYFAFSAARARKRCPACGGQFSPTVASSRKIQYLCILLSFLSGLPLGVASCYLWLIDEKPLLALLLFIAGIAAVMGLCYAYARYAIRFRINLPDLK